QEACERQRRPRRLGIEESALPFDDRDFGHVAVGMLPRAVTEKPPKDACDDQARNTINHHHWPPSRAIYLPNPLGKGSFQDQAIAALDIREREGLVAGSLQQAQSLSGQ